MNRWFSIVTLLIALGMPCRAQAAPAGNGNGSKLIALKKAFARVTTVLTERAKLLKRLRRFQRSIRATRKRPAGPARDYKLRQLLAEARALSGRLSWLDAQLRQTRALLIVARRKLIRTLARMKKAQRARARKALANTARKRRRRPRVLRIAKTRIHPLDGPRQIEEKADLLADSEEKIRRRLKEIDRVIGRLKKRQKLRTIARSVDRYNGLFAEDTSRRRLTRLRPSKTSPTVGGPGPPAQEGLATNDTDTDASYTAGGWRDDDGHGSVGGRSTSSSYAVVLKDLLTPATLAALRKAGRSADPRIRLKAMQRARQELKRAAARLRKRARQYRKRAKALRQRERQRRR